MGQYDLLLLTSQISVKFLMGTFREMKVPVSIVKAEHVLQVFSFTTIKSIDHRSLPRFPRSVRAHPEEISECNYSLMKWIMNGFERN